jgi:PncC family amidohydrolase
VAGDPLTGLAERLQGACLGRGITVAVAESCTGGLIADSITDIAGSSGYFAGGVVSYSNEAKERLLDVPHDALAAHGAVSAQVARAMADGVRSRFGATVGISVTGIAGPDGGTTAKPVGLTYVAVADGAGADVRRHMWTGNRRANKTASAEAALEMALDRIGTPASSAR